MSDSDEPTENRGDLFYVDGRPDLHQAVDNELINVVRALLAQGADPNVEDPTHFQDSPLHSAAENGSASIMNELLRAGACPNIQNCSGETPLHIACDSATVGLLLQHSDIEINAREGTGNTPLHAHVDVYGPRDSTTVDLLLQHPDIEINARNNEGKTPLVVALMGGQYHFARQMIQRGAQVTNLDDAASTALHLVADKNINQDAQLFINEILAHPDIDVNHVNAEGETALHRTLRYCNHGPDICIFIQRLLDNCGAKADLRDNSGSTPLHAVCGRRLAADDLSDVLDVLLSKNREVMNCKDGNGFTPLHVAVQNPSNGCALHLLNQEDISANEKTADDSSWTPLHIIARDKIRSGQESHQLDVLNKLVTKVPDLVNEQDANGNTPLHLACSNGNWSVVEYLLKNDVVLRHIRNHKGLTALMAAANSDSALLDFLFRLLAFTGGSMLDLE